MKNSEIAAIFSNIADILEIKNENIFRIRAYRRAALVLEEISEDISQLVKKEDITKLPGIGNDLAGKIREYLACGKIKFYEDLKKTTPKAILNFMDIPGVGPKTAKQLVDKLKIKSIKDLEKKAASGLLTRIPGIKKKTAANILRGIAFLKKSQKRKPLDMALDIADEIISNLKRIPEVKKIEIAGSLRRMTETVRDIDILVTSNKPEKVMNKFTKLSSVEEVLMHGATKSSVITKEKVQVDLRVVKPSSFGSAFAYLTGSKSHNIRLRKMAQAKGLKINEYGVFNTKTNKKIAGSDEKGLYKALNLSFIPPELREDKGEIEEAMKGKLPHLVELKDIKGDIHVHSKASDGVMGFDEIADESQELGYEYVVITDHSKSLKVAGGIEKKELFANIKKIRKLNKKYKKINVLIGSEVEILPDGKIDYEDSTLKELDFVVGAVHTSFNLSKRAQTDRIVRAMENKHVHMIAHPTGRLMGVRYGYEIDFDKIFKIAKATNTTLEINAYPERLDLDDNAVRGAKEHGVMIGIATDSHRKSQFLNMKFGVSVARRGWLEPKNIINAQGLKSFLKRIKK